MPLPSNFISLCDVNQSVIVSKENGKKHTANNQNKHSVAQYKLDRYFSSVTCCDYLLTDDTSCKAYFIELKGVDVKHAIGQLECGEQRCRQYLPGYSALYRLVMRSVTHKVQNRELVEFKRKHLKAFVCHENRLEETLI